MRRLTFRDLFWLTLVVGCFVGWGVDRGVQARRWGASQQNAIRIIECHQNHSLSLRNLLEAEGWAIESYAPGGPFALIVRPQGGRRP